MLIITGMSEVNSGRDDLLNMYNAIDAWILRVSMKQT